MVVADYDIHSATTSFDLEVGKMRDPLGLSESTFVASDSIDIKCLNRSTEVIASR